MHNVIIIGSGASGYTAAIYASRAGLNPVVVTGMMKGGQLTQTSHIENFPSYIDGIDAKLLMNNMEQQAIRFGTEVIIDNVDDINKTDNGFEVVLSSGKILSTKTVIVATGSQPKMLGIGTEDKFYGSGLGTCAVCDGFFYKGLDVVVIGSGDSACEEALYLSKICNKVTMVIRSDKFKASVIMRERVLETSNIDIIYKSEIIEFHGEHTLEGCKIINKDTLTTTDLKADGIFIAIGHTPNSSLVSKFDILDSHGYILTKNGTTETDIQGLFACGDVVDSRYRQAITAAGAGCSAAIDCERYLIHLK